MKGMERYVIAMLALLLVIFLVGVLPSGLSDTAKLNFVLTTNVGMLGGTMGMLINAYRHSKKEERG